YRRGAQRAADQLPHVAAPAGAQGPPLPVRVRLGDHRRLPSAEDGRRAVAGDGDEAEPGRAGRRLHLPGGDGRRARHGQGRDGGQAAGALRVAGAGGARLRGGRDPGRARPRDRHLRPLRARSNGVEPVKISYDARGLAEPSAQAPKTATVTRGADGATAVFDAADLTTRQINLELRRLVYDEGIDD